MIPVLSSLSIFNYDMKDADESIILETQLKKTTKFIDSAKQADSKKAADNILFIFLGGLPTEGDNFEHWKALIEDSKQNNENHDNMYFIVHPKALSDISQYIYWQQILTSRFLVVDDDHHVKTSWATRSLIDAVLLAIQYANKSKMYKKYVLLSSTCAPVYS